MRFALRPSTALGTNGSVLALLLLTACGAPDPGPVDAGSPLKCHQLPLTFSGTTGAPAAAEVLSNVFILPVKIGNTSSKALFDTGAPVTIFDPGSLPSETLPMGQGSVPSFQTNGLTFSNATVVGAPLNLVLPTGRLAGIVGGDLLCHFATSFNYRDATVTLGDAPLPASVDATGTVPMDVQGGGVGGISLGSSIAVVKIPATRIAVTVELEGVQRHFIVDSGASYSVVTTAVFDALVKDGRKVIDMIGAQTVMGAVGTRVTRARSITVGGLEVKGSLVSSLDSTLLTQLGMEVGHTVDGLIGGTYLREFYVTADYAGSQLKLSRYTTRAHIADEFIRLGFALTEIANHPAGSARWQVGRVFAGSDAAAKGITTSSKILKVDGVDLEPLDSIAVEKLMLAPAGTMKSVQTDTATLMIAVEDLLLLQ